MDTVELCYHLRPFGPVGLSSRALREVSISPSAGTALRPSLSVSDAALSASDSALRRVSPLKGVVVLLTPSYDDTECILELIHNTSKRILLMFEQAYDPLGL